MCSYLEMYSFYHSNKSRQNLNEKYCHCNRGNYGKIDNFAIEKASLIMMQGQLGERELHIKTQNVENSRVRTSEKEIWMCKCSFLKIKGRRRACTLYFGNLSESCEYRGKDRNNPGSLVSCSQKSSAFYVSRV